MRNRWLLWKHRRFLTIHEKGKLMKFKESYERAIAKAKNMKLSELRGFLQDMEL